MESAIIFLFLQLIKTIDMKKALLISIFCLTALFASAKSAIDPKYGPGSIPTDKNGKVTFTETISIPQSANLDDCYTQLLNWARGRFAMPYARKSSILSESAANKGFVFHVEQTLVFKRSWLVSDEARIFYNFSMNIKDGKCVITLTDISYSYEEEREGGGFRVSAEEWITDDKAFKDAAKTKFFKQVQKFRVKTIDLNDLLVRNVTEIINK